MDVLIVANFTQMPSEKRNGRFHYIAKKVTEEKKDKVEIVTSTFSHGCKAQRDENEIGTAPYMFTMIYEPGYPKNVCMKRFYSHWVLGRNLKKYLKTRKKPDVIYCAVPSLDVAKVTAQYAKKNNIRFITDIQDLWPEAFAMVFHMPVISNLIYAPMKKSADYIYRQADEIIAVSDTYCERALQKNKKCKDSHTVFLGTDLEQFDANLKENYTKLEDVFFNIGYCGTLGHSYDIRCVIDALDVLKREQEIENARLIVMGDGPLRQEFENYAESKQVDVQFTGRLEYPKMCAMLSACDVAVNPITHGAAQSIINKHADYAAAGIPVISTQECEEYRKLVDAYSMGFNCNNDDARDLAEKIKLLYEDKELRLKMGNNARRCAEEKFDRKSSYLEILNVIRGENTCPN